MKRKDFIKKSILGIAAGTSITNSTKAAYEEKSQSTYDQLIEQVGFNHLPNKDL